MFLKKGSIGSLLYPGTGGDHIRTVNLGRNVNNLYIVLNGFDIGYKDEDTRAARVKVDLSVLHTNGSNRAEIHFKLQLNKGADAGQMIKASVDYVLIGERAYTPPTTTKAVKKAKRKKRLHG